MCLCSVAQLLVRPHFPAAETTRRSGQNLARELGVYLVIVFMLAGRVKRKPVCLFRLLKCIRVFFDKNKAGVDYFRKAQRPQLAGSSTMSAMSIVFAPTCQASSRLSKRKAVRLMLACFRRRGDLYSPKRRKRIALVLSRYVFCLLSMPLCSRFPMIICLQNIFYDDIAPFGQR